MCVVSTDPRVRLRQLIELLGTGDASQPATARRLAEEAGVSLRTVYRDLSRLRDAGVRVVGRTGVGLRLDGPARAPALTTEGEVVARIRASKASVRALRSFAVVEADAGGALRVRGAREALLHAVLASGGELVVLGPDDLRRDVRARAREVARAHKKA
jgi:predicted DNA-binding transcriptional regulator YafY